MRSNWEEMLKALTAFKRKNGNCNVSACDADHRRLGQWVSSQRYKGRIGALPKDKVDTLTKLGFVWSASDQVWEAMFLEMAAYAKIYKTTNIPERYEQNQKLSNWVHNQRHRKKIGRLDPERARRLEEIGFQWSVRKNDDVEEAPEREVAAPEPRLDEDNKAHDERLYLIRSGHYLQYHGRGRKPKELLRFMESHGGEYPAYIPLPKGAAVFILGNDFFGGKRIEWPGKGALPEEVMEYVRENGTLPRYESLDF